jgi:aspartate/methionine/tyrosine aminotransferase
MLGPGWSSRLLQAVLLELLRDPASVAAVGEARDTYSARRAALTGCLDERGVRYTGTDGINLWIEVANEHAALLWLASQGVGVAAGTPFLTAPGNVDHIRVTIALLASGHAGLAEQLAVAALGGVSGGMWSRHR